MTPSAPTLGVLIRFCNSAETLPAVLAALKKQTLQPQVILGVDSGSTDDSRALLTASGAHLVDWRERYDHSRVLNFGIRHLETDLVLVLSSHTVLDSADTLSAMVKAMSDPATACVSLCWDEDAYFSESISWSELQAKGLRFGSFYSNSMGMIRRSLWAETPFDEDLTTSEDYAWAITQIQAGHTCTRLRLPFSYRRGGCSRDAEFANITFFLARKHGLHVAWLGVRGTLRLFARSLFSSTSQDLRPAWERLKAWAAYATRLRPLQQV